MKGFSCIAAPLFCLLKKGEEFLWTEKCQTAFTSLQEAPAGGTDPLPTWPHAPFRSGHGLPANVGSGAVLTQLTPGGERVVAYYQAGHSTKLNVATVSPGGNYSLWSAPSVTSSITSGASTSLSGRIISALQWLMSFKEPEGQLATLDRGTTGVWLHSGTQTRYAAWQRRCHSP